MGMMRKLSPRGERQLTCPHISASSQSRICTAVANLCLSSSTSLMIHRVAYTTKQRVESFDQSFGGGERRLAHRFLLFLAVVFQSMILLHGHKFPRWSDGVSFLGHRNVETASRLSESVLVGLLSLPAKKPIDEDFGRIGMRCVLDHGQSAGPGHRIDPVFQLWQWFHRKPRPNKRNEIVDI